MQHSPRLVSFLLVAICAGILTSCASLRLDTVDFGWPVESVQTVGSDNMVNEGRYAISFNVAPLATEEFGDSTALKGSTLRILRGIQGYYFVTGPRFRSVYVFATGEGELTLHTRIEVYQQSDGDQQRLSKPALNQRGSHVELIDGSLTLKLNGDGIIESEGGDQ
ncbi:MAG: hypothetical protein ACKVRP_13970 [Bacteroidota bacterium]